MRVKLTDFGFADSSFDNFCGTWTYVAPELAAMCLYSGAKHRPRYDSKVDSWSLGVMLFYMFVTPFCGLPP